MPPSNPSADAQPKASAPEAFHAPAAGGVAFVALGLCGVIIFTYVPSMTADFVRLDDYQYVVDNELVRTASWDAAWRFLSEVRKPSTVEGYYQPLTMLSLMLDATLAGQPAAELDAFQFHLTNVLLHAMTTAMVFLAMRMMFGGIAAPMLAALIFGLHPVQVESVSWISQRKTLLATPLAIGAIICYLRAARGRSGRWMAASFALYVLANLAKPTVVLLPLVLPLLDHWPLRRSVVPALREKWPFLIAMPLFAWIAIDSQASAGGGTGIGLANLTNLELVQRWVGLLCYNIMLYVGNVLVPLHLSPFRDMPADLSLSNPTILLSMIGTAALAAVWLGSARRAPSVFVGLAGAAILLLPALGPVRFMASCVADRFLYLPLFFLLLPIGELLSRLCSRVDRRAWTAGGVVLLVLVPLLAIQLRQQRVWRDSRALWEHVAAGMPNFPQALNNLAYLALTENRLDEALAYAERAHRSAPGDPQHMHILARALVRKDRAAEALPLIQESLRLGLGATQAAGQVALAQTLICLSDDAGAEAACAEAIRLGFTPSKCHAEVAEIAMRHAKRFAISAHHYRQAVEAEPENIIFRWNLGTALEYAGRDAEALKEYERVMQAHEKGGAPLPAELQRVILRLRERLRPGESGTEEPRP